MDALSQICNTFYLENSYQKSYSENETADPMDYIKILREINVPLLKNEYMFHKWKGSIRETYNYFTEIVTDVGICLSFNMLKETEIFDSNVVDPQFLSEISNNNHFDRSADGWDLEEGYKDDIRFRTFPLRSVNSEAELGLKLGLSFPPEKSDITCNNLRGFKVSFHFPGEWPQLKHHFIDFALKKKNTIAVKPQLISTSNSLKGYKPHE